ncbi:MAG: dimethyl sulfoxide reductase anchor subunit [Alphaproteobacteria bacterium]|nr:dimethyl sulfoxide reductase anchor subunit [Alphaproteobacteria bacterium]
MHPAYSVILFTTASGAGYGLLALLGLVGHFHGRASTMAFGLTAIIIALGLITVGLLSSTFHLGHPERAWRALSQWRSSWLSREGIAAVATYGPALAFGLVWTGLIDAPALVGPLGLVTAALCAVTVFTTGMIYASLKTIRVWHHPLTVPVYLVFALATGSSLLGAIAALFGRFQWVQAALAVAALLAALILKQLYWMLIDDARSTHSIEDATGLGRIGKVAQWELAHTSENYIQREMGYAVARKHADKLRLVVKGLLALAAVSMMLALALPPLAVLTAALAIGAAVTERWLFFAEAQHVSTLFYGAKSA